MLFDLGICDHVDFFFRHRIIIIGRHMYFCIRIRKMMVTVYVTNLSTYKIVQPLHFFRQEKLANLSDSGTDFAIDIGPYLRRMYNWTAMIGFASKVAWNVPRLPWRYRHCWCLLTYWLWYTGVSTRFGHRNVRVRWSLQLNGWHHDDEAPITPGSTYMACQHAKLLV